MPGLVSKEVREARSASGVVRRAAAARRGRLHLGRRHQLHAGVRALPAPRRPAQRRDRDRGRLRGEEDGARRRPLRHPAHDLSRPARRAGREHALPAAQVPAGGARERRACRRPSRPRPKPALTHDNRFFWEGVAQRELRIQRCNACQRLQHPPGPMCAGCHGLDLGFVRSQGRGSVYSFVFAHHPAVPPFEVPEPDRARRARGGHAHRLESGRRRARGRAHRHAGRGRVRRGRAGPPAAALPAGGRRRRTAWISPSASEQEAMRDLARKIFSERCSDERSKQLERSGDWFDQRAVGGAGEDEPRRARAPRGRGRQRLRDARGGARAPGSRAPPRAGAAVRVAGARRAPARALRERGAAPALARARGRRGPRAHRGARRGRERRSRAPARHGAPRRRGLAPRRGQGVRAGGNARARCCSCRRRHPTASASSWSSRGGRGRRARARRSRRTASRRRGSTLDGAQLAGRRRARRSARRRRDRRVAARPRAGGPLRDPAGCRRGGAAPHRRVHAHAQAVRAPDRVLPGRRAARRRRLHRSRGHARDAAAGGLARRRGAARARRGGGRQVVGVPRRPARRAHGAASARRHRGGRRLPDPPVLLVVEAARRDARRRQPPARAARRPARRRAARRRPEWRRAQLRRRAGSPR